jgi:type VI protein secretion system component VasK
MLARLLMLVFWILVLWGTLYGLALMYTIVHAGPSEALRQAQSGRASAAGLTNLALSVLALVVWSLIGVAVWNRRVQRKRLDAAATDPRCQAAIEGDQARRER